MTVTEEQVDLYETVNFRITELYKEMSILSKGKPDNPLNKFKLEFINEKLGEANTLLTGKHKPFNDFEKFDEDNLPTNSDVVFILSQYIDALEGWRSENVRKEQFEWYWDLVKGKSRTTHHPTRYK
jgi:hypothetical protein